ncbi:MAG TPA: hypothetical protein VE758_02670 [Chthoniobacterales bacterium]|nr:hypothetical protein [Chthoniobacterales bacterium]
MFQVLTIWTLVLTAVIVFAVAAYLIAIAYYLFQTGGSKNSHLAKLVGGLKAVRDNAAPLDRHLTKLAEGLTAVRTQLQSMDTSLGDAAEILGQ